MDKPLDSPVHCNVAENEGRSEIENLMAESSPSVEDRCVECAGERALAVGAEPI